MTHNTSTEKFEGMPFILWEPKPLRSDETYPLILSLHGSGSRVGDKYGPEYPLSKRKSLVRNFYVLFPQAEATWACPSPDAKKAMALLNWILRDHPIDPKRVHLFGNSMGGFGVFSFASHWPKKWATITACCGGVTGGREDWVAEKIKTIPTRIFHGDADKSVDVEHSRRIVKALREAKGHYCYEEISKVGHKVWPAALTQNWVSWLMVNHR